ncbi:hypothetical protein V6Z05_15050 [Leptospira venezuelensis]|uniref:hypothetical protein n=1 Tax=Leptospira venezuelensis TaxID=1958811 RepID=UPI000D0931A9|nr:hypothetical protein [Leptospira venezuelensis]
MIKKIILFIMLLMGCHKEELTESFEMRIAIIVKENVSCKPNQNNYRTDKKSFNFGDILKIEKVDKDHLVKIANHECWIDKKDTLIEESFKKILSPQSIVCNVFTEVPEGTKYYLNEELFYSMEIWPGWAGSLELKGKQYEQPLLIKIGEVKNSDAGIVLTPLYIGVQDSYGKFAGFLPKSDFQSEYQIKKLTYQKDYNGDKYLSDMKFNKSLLEKDCKANDSVGYAVNRKQVAQTYWKEIKSELKYPYFPSNCRYLDKVINCLF